MERVAVGTTLPMYNQEPPFHPSERYPELAFREVSRQPNLPYAKLRQLLRDLDYDAQRYGTSSWNPFGAIISPGQTVVLKPNFVLSFNASGGSVFAMVTHPSILRALVDYVTERAECLERAIREPVGRILSRVVRRLEEDQAI